MIFKREPALFIALVGAAINLAVAFGVHLSVDQLTAISTFDLAAVGFAIRSQVTPITGD